MNHAFAVRFCRIVAPEKLSDRFLTSGILWQKEDQLLGEQVMVAYILEVTKPWFPSSRVLPTLVETIAAEHAQLVADDSLGDQFERMLRTVNQQLNALSEQGETDWIGNLNGLVMALSGDQLHFSQTGRCPAYILQRNRIRQITDDMAVEKELHPLKTFSNLASGTLQEQDHILVGNQELYGEISLDALRRILNSSTPSQACQAIAKELKKEKNPAVSSFIIRVVPRGELEGQKATEPTEVILEEEMQSAARKLQKRLAPLFSLAHRQSVAAGKLGLQAAKQAGGVMKETVLPAAGGLAKKGLEQAKGLAHSKAAAAPEEAADEANRPVVEIVPPRKERLRQQKAAAKKPDAAPAATASPEAPAAPPLIPPSELALDSAEFIPPEAAGRPLPPLVGAATSWLTAPQHKRVAALGLAILLMLGAGLAAASRRHPLVNTATVNQNASQLSQVVDLQKKIGSAIELKQNVEASREVGQAQAILNGLSGLTDQQKKQADALWDQIQLAADTLSSTVRLGSPTARYSFPSTSLGVVAELPYFYGFSSPAGSLLRSGQGDPGQVQKSTSLPDPSDSIISLAASSESDTAGYALTHKSKVYRIVQSGTSTSLQPISPSGGEFATGDTIASYNGNVYILDGKSGLLWKYLNTGTTYNKGVSIIDSTKYDIRKGVSLAIDGSIYLLKQDGSLLKFTSGQQDTGFALKGLPDLDGSLVQPLQVLTNENTASIYVLDAGLTSSTHSTAKVLEFTKEGAYVRQYGFPKDYLQVRAFDIDPKQKKLWLLSGSEISEFDL